MEKKEVLKKIKKNGYWEITMKPSKDYGELFPDIENRKDIIRNNKVRLRGWDYPHIDKMDVASNDDSIYSSCSWSEGGKFEYWRFYKSGKFKHYFAMREDLQIDQEQKKRFQSEYNSDAEKFLSIISTLYSVTEVYEFASRLYKEKDIEKIRITIKLHDCKDRMLVFWGNQFRELFRPYICKFPDGVVKTDRVISKEKLIKEADDLALDDFIKIMGRFNFSNAKKDVFAQDQEKFLNRRI